jgi:endoribonuclease Dicer
MDAAPTFSTSEELQPTHSQQNTTPNKESAHLATHNDTNGDSELDSDESGDSTYVLKQNSVRQPRVNERRRRDGKIFELYALEQERKSTYTANSHHLNVDMFAFHQAMPTYKGYDGRERIVNSPREYQKNLFERAKLGNTIVVLPTGAFRGTETLSSQR